jgi:hypothetical protein
VRLGQSALLVACAMMCLAACKGKSNAPVKRTKSAPAVEYVTPLPPSQAPSGSSTVAPPLTAIGSLAFPGPRSPEVEPNNDSKTAQALPVNVVNGQLAALDDVDMYSLTTAQAGSFEVAAASASDLVVEVRDASGTSIAKSDRGGAGISEGMPNLAVDKGKYVVVVTTFRKNDAKTKKSPNAKPQTKPTSALPVQAFSPIQYELRAVFVANPTKAVSGIEVEPNFDAGTASDLFVGEAATGFVGWTNDVDMWKISVEGLAAKNALDIELSAVEGITPSLKIFDAVGRPVLVRQGVKSRALTVSSFVPVNNTNVPPFYFVSVSAERSNPIAPYRLSVVARVVASDDEIEPNDSNQVAQPLAIGDKVRATLQLGDVDSFVIAAAPVSRRIAVTIAPSQGSDVLGEIVIANQATTEFNHQGAGGAESVVVDIAAGSEAFIHVHGNPKRKPVPGNYDVAADLAHDDPMPPERNGSAVGPR